MIKKLDRITGDYLSNTVSVFLAKSGEGYRRSIIHTGANSLPYSVDVADFDGDGNLDILTANAGTDTVGIMQGTGDGKFEEITTFSTGTKSAPFTAAFGDFNRDDRPDIVTANNGTGNIAVLLNEKCKLRRRKYMDD